LGSSKSHMNSAPENCSLRWKAAILVGAVSFFSFIYFYEGGGWNQNSRFDLLRAIVEQHTLRIDAYHENTQDVAHFQGHYYSDKAPGLVFLAVPFAMVARPVLSMVGVDPGSPRGEFALSYIVGAFAVALPAALAGVCLFFLGMRLGAGIAGAAFAALVMCVGTPIWAYASLFWAHALVGACLVFGFAAALNVGDSSSEFGWALAVGLAAGWATVTEYPAAPASAALAVFALSQVWSRGSAARWRVVAGVGIGALICLGVLLGYLHAAFGAFRPSYSYYDPNSFSFMQQQGYMGLTYPHPDRLLKLLFGCARGLFFASPVCLAAVVGLWWMRRSNRAAAYVAGGIVAYYFLFNSSFYWWKAGLTFGPRYAGAAIPLLCLGLALAWERVSVRSRRVLVGLAVVSVFITLMAVSTTSQLAMQDSCPIVHSTWPAFWAGKMAMNRDSMLTVAEAAAGKYGAFNLGELMGLHGLASLIPLMAVWGVAGLVWVRLRREG
jgi:4-amino-4-deoxy-L-arabinose transferase-like glycosyltransferase